MKSEVSCFQFDGFEVSTRTFQVTRGGERLELEPKAIRLLVYLLENRDRVVSKEELVSAVWGGVAITDNAITRVVAQLRRELGDDSKAPRFIETLPTLGYRFVAGVTTVGTEPVAASAAKAALPVGRNQLLLPALVVMLCIAAGAFWWWDRQRHAASARPLVLRATQLTSHAGVDARPSVNPNGTDFVFCSDRSGSFELYRQNVATAQTQPLTQDGQQNIQPDWSPDGQWIAYHSVARGGLWIVAANGGETRRLTEFGSGPRWSPDGRSIVFVSASLISLAPFDQAQAGNIWTVAADGSSLRQLSTPGNPRGVPTGPSWSHDGKRIVFAMLSRDSAILELDVESGRGRALLQVGVDMPRQPGTFVSRVFDPVYGPGDEVLYFSAGGEKGEFAVWELPLRGGKPQRIFVSTDGAPTGLALVEKGRRLLFSRMKNESQIWMLRENGEQRTVFHDAVQRAFLPSYSRDGKWLSFAVEAQGRNRDFWIMPAEGGEPFPVSLETGGREDGTREGGTVWSDEGELLYNYVEGKLVEFRAFSPVTRKTRVIHRRETQGLFHPTLMPNARDLLASCSQPFNLCLGPVTAPALRQITNTREGAAFAVSDRSGQWITFNRREGDSDQIGVVKADGSAFETLTQEKGKHWAGGFSPDGRKILYAGFESGVWNLWWVDRFSRERRQLTREKGFGPFVRNPSWRPGTDEIAFERFHSRGNIFSIELPL
jgi:Tol biopolymer transport system component/DNA-binding winged helix-turn-helix (wHTH) protein